MKGKYYKGFRVIEFNHNWNYRGCGCEGEYWKIDNQIGIKMLFDNTTYLEKIFMRYAELEFERLENMNRLEVINTPKAIELLIVKKDGLYYPSIIMQHIEGKSADWNDEEKIEDICREHSIRHEDISYRNIIVERETGKLYLIDFGRYTYRDEL